MFPFPPQSGTGGFLQVNIEEGGYGPREDAMRVRNQVGVEETKTQYFRKQQAASRIDAAIKEALETLSSNEARRSAFLRLLAQVRERTALLRPVSGQPARGGWVAPVFLVNRLRNVAERSHFWLRPCETWCPEGEGLRLVFRSLVQHLFARYSVPAFMDFAWDSAPGPAGFRAQSWYISLARGASLRSLKVPVALTRRMEHHARLAPDHYTATQALRHGETLGLGGSEPLAREIAASRLGRDASHGGFWRTVIRFLAFHSELTPHAGAIVEFIHASKFAEEEVFGPGGLETRPAPWPAFRLEGRTAQSLLRLAQAWVSAGPDSGGHSWGPSGFRAYRFEETGGESGILDWSIVELLGSGALRAEGAALRHCVFTYTDKCRRGESAIWSLRLRVENVEKRMATIEVDPRHRSVVQVRAKQNRPPGGRSSAIIREWARQAELRWDAHEEEG